MKGYIEHKVKQTSVWATNVLENGAFSEDDIKKSLEDIFILKNSLNPDSNSFGIIDFPGIQYLLNYSFGSKKVGAAEDAAVAFPIVML